MDHEHLMKMESEEIRPVKIGGLYNIYEEARRVIVYRCECSRMETFYRYAWDWFFGFFGYDYKTTEP